MQNNQNNTKTPKFNFVFLQNYKLSSKKTDYFVPRNDK